MSQETDHNRHVSSGDKVTKNTKSPHQQKEPVWVTESQSMAYFRIENIESETSYSKEDWDLFVLKELLDNAWDWLNEQYPVTKIKTDNEDRKIAVTLRITQELIRIAARNSNVNNIKVFTSLDKIFDFNSWHSTKRLRHEMTAGYLGDALKRSLGMGYALYTSGYDPDTEQTIEDKQWEEPVIIRCNGNEFKIFVNVDIARSLIKPRIEPQTKPSRDIGNDTEVQITLPKTWILARYDHYDTRLGKYFKKYKMDKTKGTDFSIAILEELD